MSSLASGQVYDNTIDIKIVDYDSQIISIDSTSTIQIRASQGMSSSYKVLGSTFKQIEQGHAEFDAISFFGEPGMSDKPFWISSNAIDDE